MSTSIEELQAYYRYRDDSAIKDHRKKMVEAKSMPNYTFIATFLIGMVAFVLILVWRLVSQRYRDRDIEFSAEIPEERFSKADIVADEAITEDQVTVAEHAFRKGQQDLDEDGQDRDVGQTLELNITEEI